MNVGEGVAVLDVQVESNVDSASSPGEIHVTATDIRNTDHRKHSERVQDNDYRRMGSSKVDFSTVQDQFTVEKAVEQLGFGPFQLFVMALAGIAWTVDAMEMMILSILGPALSCEWKLSGAEEAGITTVVFIGMFLFSTVWGTICDRFGRKFGLILSSLITFYFGAISAFSPSYVWLLFLRGLTGAGIAGAPQAVTIYSEFLPSKFRASCIVLVQVFWAVGACFAVLVALVVMPGLGWRYLIMICSLPLLLFSLMCKWLPESARYQVAVGKREHAVLTIEQVAKWNRKPMPLGELRPEPAESRGRLPDLFTPELRTTTCLLWLIWLVSAFAYYGMVLVTTEIYKEMDSSGDDACLAQFDGDSASCAATCHKLTPRDYMDTLWTTVAEFPGLFITLLLIDLIGRRKTMGSVFLGFSLFCICISVSIFYCHSRTWVTVLMFSARAMIVAAFQAVYVYTPEIYPTNVRALGLGCCSGLARVGATITPFVAQVLTRHNVHLALSIYIISGLAAAVCSFLLPIETKGRALQSSANPVIH